MVVKNDEIDSFAYSVNNIPKIKKGINNLRRFLNSKFSTLVQYPLIVKNRGIQKTLAIVPQKLYFKLQYSGMCIVIINKIAIALMASR